MGCDLQTYQVRIGTWAGRSGLKMCRESCRDSPRILQFYALVISALLIIGGVELNPGPQQEAVKCQTCKKNLQTGLLCSLCMSWYHFSCQKIKRMQQIEDSWMCNQCHTKPEKGMDKIKMEEEIQDLRDKLQQAEEQIRRLEEEIQSLNAPREPKQQISCLIVGESIVKHVGQHQVDLNVKCFPGIRTEQMKEVVEQQLQEEGNPKTVIMHVEFNDISRNIDHIMGDMYDLATTVKSKFPAENIVLSSVI